MKKTRKNAIPAQQLLSKEAIHLPPKERLNLLLHAKQYPIASKKTSAKGQLKEMLDFYNLCCFMLVQYFPSEQAKNNFVFLHFVTSKKTNSSIMSDELAKCFRLLNRYEELENKISAIQSLFWQYQETFPDLYDSYNLENIATEKISDIIHNSLELLKDDSSYVEKLLQRWELL